MNTNTPKFIAYYDLDDFGSDGWWEEGDARDWIVRNAWLGASYMRIDSIPNFTYVEVAKLVELSEDEWDKLERQWRLAHRNGWTSPEVDDAVRMEIDRRST